MCNGETNKQNIANFYPGNIFFWGLGGGWWRSVQTKGKCEMEAVLHDNR